VYETEADTVSGDNIGDLRKLALCRPKGIFFTGSAEIIKIIDMYREAFQKDHLSVIDVIMSNANRMVKEYFVTNVLFRVKRNMPPIPVDCADTEIYRRGG
jgi:hypothetical protein